MQWIWQNLEFSTQNLRTQCGKSVTIIYQGKRNSGEGPDFSGASIVMDSLEYHGDVELHIRPGGWVEHKHENSVLYNRVVLHVVFEDKQEVRSGAVKRPDGTSPPLLVLKPYVQKTLQHLFEKSQVRGLPCSGHIQFINQSAFEKQVEKAHKSYFEYKIAELLKHYPAQLPIPDAWRYLFTAGLFETLGIPRNRKAMLHFHRELATNAGDITEQDSIQRFVEKAQYIAFSGGDEDLEKIGWESTGMRPASRPAKRAGQAAALFYTVNQLPFKQYLDPELSSWNKIMEMLPAEHKPGGQMEKILRQTIFLPAEYLLGDLLHSARIKSAAYSEWRSICGGVPPEVQKPFSSSGFEINQKTKKPGLAHQLKRYCRAGKCHQCEVFKKAICS
nr:DUF2851 family protein [Rhodohalobacter sp. SW132]